MRSTPRHEHSRARCARRPPALPCARGARVGQDGIQQLKFSYGPVKISPGRNTIGLALNEQRPKVDGWIGRLPARTVRKDGSVPRVDVIHLHHGVWLKDFQPLFAAGEGRRRR
jgi:hypothetical protein